MFVHQAHSAEKLAIADDHRAYADKVIAQAREENERRFREEMKDAVEREVRRIDAEKGDRVDKRMRDENERLNKKLATAQDSIEYLEKMLERVQGSQNEGNEENRELKRKVKKLEYILYGKGSKK